MKDLGIQKGEIVAIDGPNSPEYLMLWFALDGIGAVPSFVNCNLTGQSLLHCVKVRRDGPLLAAHSGKISETNSSLTLVQLCDSRYLIAEREIQNLVEPIRDDPREGQYRRTVLRSALSRVSGRRDSASTRAYKGHQA